MLHLARCGGGRDLKEVSIEPGLPGTGLCSVTCLDVGKGAVSRTVGTTFLTRFSTEEWSGIIDHWPSAGVERQIQQGDGMICHDAHLNNRHCFAPQLVFGRGTTDAELRVAFGKGTTAICSPRLL